MMKHTFQVASYYETKRLVIQDTEMTDAKPLQSVYDSCRYLLDWEGKTQQYDKQFIIKLLEKPDYPPNGSKDNLRIQTIRLKSTQEIIGVLETYHGYPSDKLFWVSMLLIHKDHQQQGYGQEVINTVTQQVKSLKVYSAMQCAVYLKNWPGIRFWSQLGFNQIVKYYGDKMHSENDHAALRLQCNLS